jgi:8-oxo-dGTP pyrophosphatase MutT (NUDIX family)
MIKPWRKKSEERIAGKYGKELHSVIFINPATKEEEEFILFSQKDWSVILPVTENNQVVTVLQYKQGCNKVIRELPAGTADFEDEVPEQVASRELLEKTGYQAKRLIFLGPPCWMSTRNSRTRFFPFLATGCEKVQKAEYDTSEEIKTGLIPLGIWFQMALHDIEEPSAIIATYRALGRLGMTFQKTKDS